MRLLGILKKMKVTNTGKKFYANNDIFNSFLVRDAEYDGEMELPVLRTSDMLPEGVITFSKAMSSKSKKDYYVLCRMAVLYYIDLFRHLMVHLRWILIK